MDNRILIASLLIVVIGLGYRYSKRKKIINS